VNDPLRLDGKAALVTSPAARYIHGTIPPVDGGWLAR
jgi:hypothetical protein